MSARFWYHAVDELDSKQLNAATAETATGPPSFLGPWRLAGGLLALAAFAWAFAFPPDYDFWWHLTAGRYIVLRHALPIPDPFSFTAAGHAWIAHEWLSEAAMYASYRWLGMGGPSALYAVVSAVAALLVFDTLRRLGVRLLPATWWTAVMFAVLAPWLGPRPQVAAFALLAGLIWLLERWIVRRDRSIWLLPALFCLWGNLHGSFEIGLGYVALVLGAETFAARYGCNLATRLDAAGRRRLAAALTAAVLALAVNPNGPALLLYPLTKLNNPLLSYLNQWSPRGLNDPVMWPFFLIAGLYLALLTVRRLEIWIADLLVAAGFLAGALWSFRFVPFAAICLVVLMGRALTLPDMGILRLPAPLGKLAAWRGRRAQGFARPALRAQVLNAVLLLLLVAGMAAWLRPYNVEQDPTLPVKAVDVLGAEGLQGPLFHNYIWGGYLLWRLWPRVRVFIDGRGDDLYMNGGVLQSYFEVAQLGPGGDAVLARYGIRTVLFPKDSALTRYLLAGGRWKTTYDDGQVVRLQLTP